MMSSKPDSMQPHFHLQRTVTYRLPTDNLTKLLGNADVVSQNERIVRKSYDYRVPRFSANGIDTGIKTEGGRDLSMIYSANQATAAGVFTTNSFKAAPVILDQERMVSCTGIMGEFFASI